MDKKSESQIQKEILEYLQSKKIFSWRQNAGGVKSSYGGKERFFKFIRFNFPENIKIEPSDICGLHKGNFFAIEVKVPGKELKEGQNNFIKLVNDYNGCGIVATSVQDVKNLIESIQKWQERNT